MLSRIDLVLDNKCVNVQMGSLFHGFLMEFIDTDYAETLHSMNINPFTQFLYFDKEIESYVWRVNGLTEEIYNKMIKKLEKVETIYLKHKDMNIKVKNRIIMKPIAIEDFIYEIYVKDAVRKTNVKFITPTSFKSNGKYLNFPDISLIYRSPAMKLNAFSTKIKAIEQTTFNEIEQRTTINRYRLSSAYFHIEKVKINSFVGEMTFNVKGNEELIRFASMLLRLSEFTGVGIKTSLGMGGVIIE